jgi:hypothetical protein
MKNRLGPSATPTSTATPGTVIFADDFNDGDLSGWTSTGGTWTNPGAYLRGVSNAYTCYDARPESAADFAYEGTVTLVSGTAAGLIFRASSGGALCYGAVLDAPSGRFKLCINWEGWFGAAQLLTVEYNHPYRIRVEARGDVLDAWLDGGYHLHDSMDRYSSGQFGVLVTNGEAKFDDLIATTLP